MVLALGSPVLYEEIEEKVTELVGGEDTLLFPTITHIHMSVIPVLAGAGTVFLDGRAHKTIYDGAMIARGHGATVQRFRHDDPAHLEELLRSSVVTPRVIALDGVNSMLGNAPDLRSSLDWLASTTRSSTSTTPTGSGWASAPPTSSPRGTRGNGVIRHQGESYENGSSSPASPRRTRPCSPSSPSPRD